MPKLRPFRAGKLVELEPITLRGLGPRRVRAHLPAPRAGDGERPLLVLLDGQNVLDDAGSFAGGWFAHEAVDQLGRWKPTPPLLVAVDHGHHLRIDELTPFSDGQRGGKLDVLLGAIVRQLLPRLRQHFDLARGPAAHHVGGASLGGLAALTMHLRRPDIFGGAMAMSPSLWFTRSRFEAFVRGAPNPKLSRVYLDAGAREGGGNTARLVQELGRRLRARGWGPPGERGDRRLLVRIDARGLHNERSWRRRLPTALRFLCEP